MYDLMRQVGRGESIATLTEELVETHVPVQGVHIGVDEVYAAWYYGLMLGHLWPSRLGHPRHRWIEHLPELYAPVPELGEFPPWWGSYATRAGYGEGASPFYIRVILRATDQQGRPPALPSRIGPYRIVYETRSPAVALATGGTTSLAGGQGIIGHSTGQLGTCGGVLQDFLSATKYGLTCRHVLPHSEAALDARSRTMLGSCTEVGALTPKPLGCYCNTRSMPAAATTDWALFEVDASVSTRSHGSRHGRVAVIESARTIGQYMDVEFEGATTGVRKCQTGCLCVWHEVDVDGTPHCFGDLIELKWRASRLLNPTLAKGGDSGAWLIAPLQGPGAAWCGVLIAGDGAQAYCAFAENVLDQVRQALGRSQVGLLL